MDNSTKNQNAFLIDPRCQNVVTYEKLKHDLSSNELPEVSEIYAQLLSLLKVIYANTEGKTKATYKLIDATEVNQSVNLATSGTTGPEKPIAVDSAKLFRAIKICSKCSDDIWGLTYPAFSFAGTQVILQAYANGNPLVDLSGLSWHKISKAIKSNQISHLSATPTFYRMLCSLNQRFPKILQVTSSGEQLNAATINAIKTTFPNSRLTNVYASTEVGVLLKSSDDKFTIPRELSEKIKVVKNQLFVHRSLLDLANPNNSEEFFPTGDMVEVQQKKPLQIIFMGRQQETLLVGGTKVYPAKIESLICAQPEIIDTRVFGVKNSVTGQLVCCEIVTEPNALFNEEKFRRELSRSLEKFEIPRFIYVVSKIRRTKTGKKERN